MNLKALVRALIGRYNWRIANQRIVNTWIWHQVGLELIEVDIKCAIETQAGGDGADHLGN
jgi:hypothetical protein